ncbi:MAG: DUF6125 family protein [Thermodesulfobacteriota bacterium]|nr:DUF6125 family protein [Thermodesulfobacteriota bacterium]
MDFDFLKTLGPGGCEKYIDFLLWHYKVMDAFWFIRIEEEYGLAVAEDINERVWGKVGQLGARGIKQRFNITEKGLKGFTEALKLFPWAILVGYDIKDEGDALIIEVPHCPAQEGRLKHGLGEYSCKEMHYSEFSWFAREIDPDIKVECVFAPPDPHPPELFCRWRFTMSP